MSAETLRQAAALMRERADIPSPSFWSAAFIEGAFAAHEHVDIDAVGVPDTIRHGAEHIASWHPVVAFAVADWLEHQARYAARTNTGYNSGSSHGSHALAVARAYLGEGAA